MRSKRRSWAKISFSWNKRRAAMRFGAARFIGTWNALLGEVVFTAPVSRLTGGQPIIYA
jgi:hypothetical protein